MIMIDQVIQILDEVSQMPSESLESDLLEFKNYSSENSLHNAKDLAEEISALANYKGGQIIIGVKDSSNVAYGRWSEQLVGFDRVDLHTTRERIRGKLKPSLDIELIEINHRDKNYLLINVPRKRDSLVSTASGKVCIRDGKSSRPMTPEEIEFAVKHLQDYDWSSEALDLTPESALNDVAVLEALSDFSSRRNIKDIDKLTFLEAIGATNNGELTKSGLLFLGQPDLIRKHLGRYEYRFSRKTKAGDLIINDVWEDCLWETIKRGKAYFDSCNNNITLEFEGNKYPVQLLDRIAFHEAYLNALVHRDYSVDGMVSVNFTGNKLVITSPGLFYGGITAENIAKHEPRHRNKSLAKMLMEYHLVDRAGMGVLRMSINSLRYGRSLPEFVEISDSVEVTMQGEYIRPGIFVMTASEGDKYGIPELLILNSIHEVGVVPVQNVLKQLGKVVTDPWSDIESAIGSLESVEICGNREGIFIRVKPEWNKLLKVTKTFRVTSSSANHVKLYRYLVRHGKASNADIKAHLGFKQTSQTSAFLKSTTYVKRTGRGPSAVWSLAERE